jgi:hypothetical protein
MHQNVASDDIEILDGTLLSLLSVMAKQIPRTGIYDAFSFSLIGFNGIQLGQLGAQKKLQTAYSCSEEWGILGRAKNSKVGG